MTKLSNEEKAKPFSIRLTEKEKAFLKEKAAGVPIGKFIRSLILDENIRDRTAKRQYPIRDGKALGQVLGLLGQSHLSNNLNQLAKAANLGALPVTIETEVDLKQACAAVTEMRRLLLVALGIRTLGDGTENALTAVFAQSAEHSHDS